MSRFAPLMTSRANYWGGTALDLAASIVALVAGFRLGHVAAVLAAALAGLLWYSLCEYAIHRWLYHTGRNIAAVAHARHHVEPGVVYGPPFYYGVAIAALHAVLVALPFGAASGLAFAGALLLGYVQHGLVHHSAHRYPILDILGSRSALRKHHALHHRVGRGNFGVSTMWWDRMFGTLVTTAGERTRPP